MPANWNKERQKKKANPIQALNGSGMALISLAFFTVNTY
jgi:hypothetical protein